ncbi:MAG: TonB-dependent receptor [Bryobacteraceae bacterium]|nr:TonB-dependent receptor [Bryobacteraceae bacterium]
MLAQTTTGTFGGTVSDATGGRVAQAAVTALNVETGQQYKAVTSHIGDFVIVQVPPGNYEIDVVAPGFKTLSRKGLNLEVAGKVTLDLTLEIGSISESVSVTGEAPMLRTQDAQIGEIINSLAVENVPQLDRDPLNLLRLSGDISGDINANSPAGSPGSNVRINGGRMQGMDVLIDGNSVISGKYHALYAGATPSMEQVEEFKVITNGIPAEYGRVSGGLVTLATKGGTNGLHGQGFEYFRNQMLNAQTWEQNWQAQTPATFHQNDFGGAIGGPVVLPKVYDGRNKTFFFFNYEGVRASHGGTSELGMAASQNDRNGNLSGLLSGGGSGYGPTMYDPLGDVAFEVLPNTAQYPGGPLPAAACTVAPGCQVKLTLFPNNGTVIPAARLDGYAQKVDALMPLPNHTPTPGWSQMDAYLGYQNSFTTDNRWETRIDHNLTTNNRLTLRFDRDNYTNGQSSWYDELNPGNQQVRPGALQGSLGWTWTASPTLVLELRGSVMHNPSTSGYIFPNNEANWPIDPVMMGLTGGFPGAIDNRVWSSNGSGWGDYPGVQNQDVASLDAQTTYTASAAVTKIWRQHTFKTGFETRRMYDNHWEKLYGPADYQGSATVQSNDNRWDDTINHNTQSPGAAYADSWGSWLLGMPDDSSQTSRLTLANAQNYYAAYIQDDFKVNQKLTLNLGLRWDMETPLTERYKDIYAWNPNAPSAYSLSGYSWTGALQTAGLTAAQIAQVPTPSWVTNGKLPNGAPCYAGTPQCPSNVLFKYHPRQFAPRLAAAYALGSKTVLRASWGMMYLTATGDYWDSWVTAQANASSPYPPDRTDGNTGTQVHTNMSQFLSTEVIPFNRTNAALNYTIGGFGEQAGTDVNKHPPMEQNWNLGIQRQLPTNILLEVGYNGNHSGDLLTSQTMSPYPVNLINPKFGSLFATQVANPLAGQVQALNSFSQATVPLGILMLSNPAFGGLNLYGQNIGRANYNAATLKVQKRLSQGLTFLFTYTYSKSLDDVGSPASISTGSGAKAAQSFQTVSNLYGYSPYDMTHRLTFYHDYQLPFGRGRRFLGSPKGVSGKVLDGIAGGWEYAGIWIHHSGTPLQFTTLSDNVSITQGISALFGSITGNIGQITPSSFNGNPNSLLTSGQVNVGSGGTDLGSATGRRFDPSLFTNPVSMTPGNIPNIYPWIRNPGANSYDASLMKNFAIAQEGKIYLQFRVEAQNVLNIRGLGGYNTTYGSPDFGLITSSAQDPRNMQVSARLFF